MALTVSLDLETSSESPLQTVGAYQYIDHPSTRVLMLAWHEVGSPEQPRLWCEGDPVPEDFCAYVSQGCLFSGWNVNFFDRLGYRTLLAGRFGFPPIPDDNWVDSMHRAAAANLPRSLDGAAKAVGVPFDADKKDNTRIRRITNALVTPIPWLVSDILSGRAPDAAKQRTAPGLTLLDDMQWLAARCVQDVVMEEAVLLALPEWPQMAPWKFMPHIDRRINDRGILLDVKLVEGLALAASIEAHTLDEDMNRITKGKVTRATKVADLKDFLIASGVELPSNLEPSDDEEENPEVEEENSRKSPWKLRKNDIADIMARDDVPEECRLAVGIRAEASKASARKFNTMRSHVSFDGRLRATTNLGGAQQTMRWASTGVNLYNTVRDVFANPDEIADDYGLNAKTEHDAVKRLQNKVLSEAILTGRLGAPDLIRERYQKPRKDAQGRMQMAGVLTWISRMTRRTLAAPAGSVLLNGDFAQIEARVTVWLAQQHDMLAAFASREDVYKIAAAGIYHVPVETLTKQMRQVGKVAILACGFGGGVNALITMGYNYGLLMSEADATPIVKAYREANTAVRAYWYATDDAAANAVRYPGHEFPVAPLGLVTYFMAKDGTDCLCCRLPSTRLLRYWAPRLSQEYWKNEDGTKGKPKDRLSLSGIAIKGRSIFRRSLYHTVLCLSGETRVVTSSGIKTLAQIDKQDMVWDGLQWASHEGLVCQGVKRTLDFGGVYMTPDHEVLHSAGWKEARYGSYDDAASTFEQSYRIPSGVFDGKGVPRCRRGDHLAAKPEPLGQRMSGATGWRERIYAALSTEPRLSGLSPVRVCRREEPVFDLVNAGPYHRFTVVGADGRLIIVSNCENQIQAIATADMMGHALDNADRNGLRTVLHVYDSAAAEVDEDRAEAMLPVFEQCMLDQPAWTKGLPIGIDTEISARFG